MPNPVTNKGRFLWIESELRYTFSNGVSWNINSIIVSPYTNLWAWGSNTYGQLGDNSTANRSSPVSVVGGFTDWIQVSNGTVHSLGLRSNGTIWSWGNAAAGRLGDGTVANKSSPVSVVGGFTDWTQVSAGQFHSVGLRANGTAWAWGVNLDGQLGDFSGSNASKSSPVSVVGGFTDWIQLSASLTHTSGVRANGTAWAWGNNSGGKLGDNSITNKSSPVSVVGGIVDWIQISAGSVHTSGVRANGTAWAWGNNSGGQLGDNTTVGKSSPVSVIGGFVDWIQISAGQSAGGPFSLGLRANGTAWAWGNGGSGKLGDGTAVGKSSPVSVVGGFTDWLQISGGNNHSVGIRANGTAWAWGANGSGEFGNGIASLGSTSPVSAAVGFTDWVQLNASAFAVSFGIRG